MPGRDVSSVQDKHSTQAKTIIYSSEMHLHEDLARDSGGAGRWMRVEYLDLNVLDGLEDTCVCDT